MASAATKGSNQIPNQSQQSRFSTCRHGTSSRRDTERGKDTHTHTHTEREI